MESRQHLRLKQLAAAFLRDRGCTAVAFEVTCPFARFRLDVAGWADRPAAPLMPPGAAAASRASRAASRPLSGPRRPRTILVECKRSRGDFLRDARNLARLQAERDVLEQLRARMEDRLRREGEPGLRRSEPRLFGEMESWDFARSRHPGYRDLLRRLAALDRRIHGETKFLLAARYRLADRLYVAAPAGLLRPRELPTGWGLLEAGAADLDGAGADVAPDLFGASRLRITKPAPDLGVARAGYRDRLLRNIAVAASRDAMRAIGGDLGAATTAGAERARGVASVNVDVAGAPKHARAKRTSGTSPHDDGHGRRTARTPRGSAGAEASVQAALPFARGEDGRAASVD